MYFVVQKREIEDIYICSADDNRVLYRATIFSLLLTLHGRICSCVYTDAYVLHFFE